MCVLVDRSFHSLEMGGVTVVQICHDQDGFWTAAKMMRRGVLQPDRFDAVFAALGRAEVLTGQLGQAAEDFVATFRRFNKKASLFLTGPIPRFEDNKTVVARCIGSAGIIKRLCSNTPGVQFSGAAQFFHTKQGVNLVNMQQAGATPAGILALKKNIKAKLSAVVGGAV